MSHAGHVCCVLFVLLAVAALPTAARPPFEDPKREGAEIRGNGLLPPGRVEAPADAGNGGGMTAKDAARQAQARNGGGRVLSVDSAAGGWRVKLLKDGDVRFVYVPN